MKKIIVAVMAVMVASAAMAQDAPQDSLRDAHQEQEKGFFQRLKEWRIGKLESKCDTNYLAIPEYDWCSRVGDVSEFNSYRFNLGDGQYKEGKSGYNNRIRVGLYWRGIGLSWGIGINKNIDRNLSLGLNGNKIGGNFNWQQNNRMIGLDNVDFNHLDLNIYYVFNPRKYSINAVTRHTFIQKKSAGSFFLTADFNRSVVKLHKDNKDDVLVASNPIFNNAYHQLRAALGAGYGYNLSFRQGKFVLHASYAPNVNFLNVIRQYDINNENGELFSSSLGLAYGHNISVGGFYDIRHRIVIGFLGSDRYSMGNASIPYSVAYNGCGIEGYVKVRF